MQRIEATPACEIFWLQIAATHPALPGHFPGRPIVPGVLLLERMLESLRSALSPHYRLLGFPNIKFFRPVLPDTWLLLGIEVLLPEHGSFIYRNQGKTVAQGSFTLQRALA